MISTMPLLTVIGMSWEEISDDTTPINIIVDEVQFVYNCSLSFWGDLKALMSRAKNLRVLLLATYDPTMSHTSPITISTALGLSSLRLTQDEFGKLVEVYVQKRQGRFNDRSFNIPISVEKVIYNFTNGYPGLCRTALSDLRQRFPNGGSSNAMLKHLASEVFLQRLTSSRAFYWIRNLQPENEEADFLRRLLMRCNPDSSFEPITPYASPIVNVFLKIGIITVDEHYQRMHFSAPIIRIVLSHHLFTAPINIINMPRLSLKNFDEFVLRTIERMRPSVLSSSLGRGVDDLLLERTWQMEWYRAARSVLPEGTTISPDVGHVFGSDGFLDFYVHGTFGWGIELVREGNKLKKHAERFEPDGKYNDIPMNEWAIIDFRHHSKHVRNLEPHFCHVLYSDDYKQVTIQRRDHEERAISLVGDNFGNV